MRADRLLSILLLLQVQRRITARELALRLEVSERTIHRDMEALSSIGVSVVAERGTGGGWSLLEEYRTNLTGLNEPEIQSLFLSTPAHLLTDLGLHQASEAALIKLLAVLPEMQRRNAEYVSQRIHIDATSWHSQAEVVPALPILQQAIWRDRKVCFRYRRSDELVERLVDPLGLVAKGNVWYFIAAVEDQLRSYRVSRIQEACISEQPFTRPTTFDLAAYWAQSSKDFKAGLRCYVVTLRADPAVMTRIETSKMFRVEPCSRPDSAGWLTFTLRFDTSYEACSYIFSFGSHVEILDPPELREQVIQLAENVLILYTQKSSLEC